MFSSFMLCCCISTSRVSAAPANGIARALVERCLHLLQQFTHLGVFETHHLGRAADHAGRRLEGREQYLLLGREVRQQFVAETGEFGHGGRPVALDAGSLGIGEQLVAVLVMVMQGFSGAHRV